MTYYPSFLIWGSGIGLFVCTVLLVDFCSHVELELEPKPRPRAKHRSPIFEVLQPFTECFGALHWSNSRALFFFSFLYTPFPVSCIVIISSSVWNWIWRKIVLPHKNRGFWTTFLQISFKFPVCFLFSLLFLLSLFLSLSFCNSSSARNVLLQWN